MIRIALIRQKYNPAGGAERFVSRALDALAQEGGVSVTLLTRRWEGQAQGERCIIDPFYVGNVWRDAGFARAVQQHLAEQPFDLVQSHERIAGCDIFRAGDGVHAEWLVQRRRQLNAWGRFKLALNPYHHYVCRAEAEMFRHPRLQAVICNSRRVREDVKQHFGLDDAQLPVIYNGVDTALFHPNLQSHRAEVRQRYGIPETAPLLLYVGSGFERKGVGRAIQALAAHAEVHLMIVGGDKHARRYQALATQLGLEARVHFAGVQKDVKPFYGAADALILPTLYDPFPNVCIEALACGLPLLTSQQCGAAELLKTGETGWVCDALDVAGLTQHIGHWLAARPHWDRLRHQARQLAEPFTLESTAQALIALYQRLLAAR